MTLLLTIYGKRTRRVIICEEINTQKHKVKLIIGQNFTFWCKFVIFVISAFKPIK